MPSAPSAATCDVTGAKHWSSTLQKVTVEANTISYITVIKSCAEARDVSRAEHWVFTMMKATVVAKTTVEANTISYIS